MAAPAPTGNFLANTRSNFKPFTALQYSANGVVPMDLPRSGFGVGVWAMLKGTATATGNATAAQFPPTPWSLVKNLRVFSSDNTEVYQTDGWGNYKYQRTQRSGWDPARSPANFLGGFTDPSTRYFQPCVNMVNGDVKTFTCLLWVPFTNGRNWSNSLILLQNSSSTWTMEVTWGSVNDLFSSGASNVTLSNVSLTPVLEFASIPTNTQDYPNVSYLKVVKVQRQSITTTGANIYECPTGNLYNILLSEFVNNGVPMDMSKITGFTFGYSGTQQPYSLVPDMVLAEQCYNYGGDLPSAVYSRDFRLGNGIPEIPTFRDVINAASVTDFQFGYTLDSTLSLTNAYVDHIREQLMPVRPA